MGHADVETASQSYLSVADRDIAAAYQKFSPVANLMSTGPTEPATIGIEDRRTTTPQI